MASSSKFVAVVAIDFGTTYSGFAFSFYDEKGEEGIHMNRDWGNDEGRLTMKIPTTILLTPNKGFDSFGYDADEKYVHFESGEEREYYYFKHFKMELHSSKNLNYTTQLTAANGKKVEALVVFSLSIKYLADKAVEIIRERTGDNFYTANDIQWVITVPAIWTPAAKQFMREAVYKAGIASESNPEQLKLALEPEVAAIFCHERKMRDFTDEKGDTDVSSVFTCPGSRYLVMDIGGGTLDVTAHEIKADRSMKEVHKVTGGSYGGIYVDEEFVSLLENVFGITAVKNFRISYPAEWLRLMDDFERNKRGRRAFEGKPTRIALPRDFIRLLVTDFTPSGRDVEIYNNEFLCLGPNAMKQLFEPIISRIVSHMTSLFMSPALKNISCLFMIGGFAESVILQDAIKREFGSRFKILIPNYASIAVVQGATIFGKKQGIVSSRIMATTYGFGTTTVFDSKVHPLEKKIIVEGKAKCKDIFRIVVKEDDVIKVGKKKVFIQYPLHGDKEIFRIPFFTSANANVQYTTDASVGHLGDLFIKSPDVSKGENRKIKVKIYFGKTEIKVTAKDKTSKNTATVYFDFLSKS